jgi:hypothetical protein
VPGGRATAPGSAPYRPRYCRPVRCRSPRLYPDRDFLLACDTCLRRVVRGSGKPDAALPRDFSGVLGRRRAADLHGGQAHAHGRGHRHQLPPVRCVALLAFAATAISGPGSVCSWGWRAITHGRVCCVMSKESVYLPSPSFTHQRSQLLGHLDYQGASLQDPFPEGFRAIAWRSRLVWTLDTAMRD